MSDQTGRSFHVVATNYLREQGGWVKGFKDEEVQPWCISFKIPFVVP